jgi:hypothetical protein
MVLLLYWDDGINGVVFFVVINGKVIEKVVSKFAQQYVIVV